VRGQAERCRIRCSFGLFHRVGSGPAPDGRGVGGTATARQGDELGARRYAPRTRIIRRQTRGHSPYAARRLRGLLKPLKRKGKRQGGGSYSRPLFFRRIMFLNCWRLEPAHLSDFPSAAYRIACSRPASGSRSQAPQFPPRRCMVFVADWRWWLAKAIVAGERISGRLTPPNLDFIVSRCLGIQAREHRS
jgi:hypothetical protein